MPQYRYVGLDSGGAERRGVIEAEDGKAAARLLRQRSIFPEKVSAVNAAADGDGVGPLAHLNPLRLLSPGVNDMVTLYRQLAMMLRAGIPLATALEECARMQQRLTLARAIGRVNKRIAEGASFAAACGQEKRIFPPLATNLMAAGEQSGNLEMVLDRLAESIERSHDIKRQLMSAMFYPSFVLVVAAGIVVFMVVWVIPKFSTFLSARHAELPASTLMLLDFAQWARDYGMYVSGALGGAVLLLLAAYTTKAGKRRIDAFVLRIPVIGAATLVAAMAQASWNLSMLIRSGITILEALRVLGRVVGNLAVADCFKGAADELLKGCALSKAFERQRHITRMMRQMAAVGERSGELDAVMRGVGEYYQKELASKLKFLVVVIEPTLILLTGGIVFCVYYSLFQAVMAVSKGGM
ncbi:MAG: type II secretion system F family protein [Acidobacteriota bacterium]|jgi:type IV pilus assembly protein PilC|nr:type II secretion system F family protein [Acidobacteriota bacterium]